jgi:hypothetical protein
MKQPVSHARQQYAAGNLEAARVIAADPVAYPVGSLMAQWADAILNRAVEPQDAKAGLLFKEAACG